MLQQFLFRKRNSITLSIQDWLFLSVIFSCLLLMARVAETGKFTYAFLLWNLFLAFVPYGITQWLSRNVQVIESKWKLAIVLLVWLLFIPNAFYIITDLFHLEHFDQAPKWFDLLMVFSFAWNGLLLGIISVRKVQLILNMVSGRILSNLAVFIVMWLNAFGVYLGRYLRFNSWDIITKPFSLAGEMLEILFHPLQNKMEWGMITVYAIFMSLLYITISKLSENFQKANH